VQGLKLKILHNTGRIIWMIFKTNFSGFVGSFILGYLIKFHGFAQGVSEL